MKYYALLAPLPPKYDPSEYFGSLKKPFGQIVWKIQFKQKWAWPFSGILQRIEVLAHIPCCSLGSNYPKTVELPSAKLSAHKSYFRSWTTSLFSLVMHII